MGNVNHRNLLKKYIALVILSEGTDFIPPNSEHFTFIFDKIEYSFNKWELQELLKLSKEANIDRRG